MKKSNQYWCGAAFFAICTYVIVQSFSNPLYAGLTGGACAVVSVVLLGFGFWSAERAQRADQEREQNHLETQNQSILTALNQIQQSLESLYQEVHTFRTDVDSRARTMEQVGSEVKAFLQKNCNAQQKNHTEDVEQMQKGFISVHQQLHLLHVVMEQMEPLQEKLCQLLGDLNQKTEFVQKLVEEGKEEVRSVLITQGTDAQEYYGYMVDQPWEELKTLSVSTQSLSEHLENAVTMFEDFQDGWNKHYKLILNEMQKNGTAQEDLIQNLCQMLENQGLENRKEMEQLMSAYSDVTSQDVKVLSALAKGIKK